MPRPTVVAMYSLMAIGVLLNRCNSRPTTPIITNKKQIDAGSGKSPGLDSAITTADLDNPSSTIDGGAVPVDGASKDLLSNYLDDSGIASSGQCPGTSPTPSYQCQQAALSWQIVSQPLSQGSLLDVWASSDKDVWVVDATKSIKGFGDNSLLHYDGTKWTQKQFVQNPWLVLGGTSGELLLSIRHPLDGGDISIQSYQQNNLTDIYRRTYDADHFDYSVDSMWISPQADEIWFSVFWSHMMSHSIVNHAVRSSGKWVMDNANSDLDFCNDCEVTIGGADTKNVWAFSGGISNGPTPDTVEFKKYDGKAWKAWDVGSPTLAKRIRKFELNAIWGQTTNNVWAIGGERVYGCKINPAERTMIGVVMHFNGTQWALVPLPPDTNELTDIVGTGANDIYVVGKKGTLLHYDGNCWAKLTNLPVSNGLLNAIWATPEKSIWVVGENGLVLRH